MNSAFRTAFLLDEHSRGNGRGWVDNQHDCAEGELRGQAMLIKITEDTRKYAGEQAVSDDQALRTGMEQKSKEFAGTGPRSTQRRNELVPREKPLRARTRFYDDSFVQSSQRRTKLINSPYGVEDQSGSSPD